jgi:hypothetical protein
MHKNLKFTTTEENNKQITYMDLNIPKRQGNIQIDIYWKRETTDNHNMTSCHPGEHKTETFESLLPRLHNLALSKN